MLEQNGCQIIRPPTTPDLCKNLIKKLYKLTVTQIKELNGYDDRNYYVIACNQNNTFDKYILKITNSFESNITGLIEGLTKLILHLSDNGISVPIPIQNINSKYLSYETFESDSNQQSDVNAVRLLRYIDGKILYDITYSPSILFKCGQFLAKISIALQTFDDKVLRSRSFLWSLLNVCRIRDMIDAIDIDYHKQIVINIISKFENEVLLQINRFEHSIIHGDFNEQNIIVDCNENDWNVKGVIDFGDVHFAPKVFDLAILLTYTMLKCETIDPIIAPSFALNGYLSLGHINQVDLNILPISIKSRLCQSLVIGAYTHKRDPSNDYVLTTAKTGWSVLEKLYVENDEQLLSKWLQFGNK